jgi:hypothetical protein
VPCLSPGCVSRAHSHRGAVALQPGRAPPPTRHGSSGSRSGSHGSSGSRSGSHGSSGSRSGSGGVSSGAPLTPPTLPLLRDALGEEVRAAQ